MEKRNWKRYIFPPKKRVLIYIVLVAVFQLYSQLYPINIWGLELKAKEIILKKGNVTLILMPMSHVAEKEFYNDVKERYKDIKNKIVLTEGINMDGDGDLSHNAAADVFNLESQKVTMFNNYNNKNADIHYDDTSLTTKEKLPLFLDFFENVKAKGWIKAISIVINLYYNEQVSRKDIKVIYEDIITKRNKVLISHIENNLNKYTTVVVPWGGIHMIELEGYFKKRGYRITETNNIKILNILKVSYFVLKTELFG